MRLLTSALPLASALAMILACASLRAEEAGATPTSHPDAAPGQGSGAGSGVDSGPKGTPPPVAGRTPVGAHENDGTPSHDANDPKATGDEHQHGTPHGDKSTKGQDKPAPGGDSTRGLPATTGENTGRTKPDGTKPDGDEHQHATPAK